MPQTSSGNMAQADAASGGAAENKQAPVFIIARVGRAHDGSGQVSDRKIHAIAQLDGDKIGSSQEPSFFYDDDIYVLAALGHTDSPGVCNFGHVSHVLVKYPLAADGVRQCIDQVQQISSMIKCATDKNVIPRMAVLSGGRILAAGSPANNAIEQQILDTIYAIEAEIPVPSPTTPVPPKSSLRMAYESVLRDYEQDVTLQNEALELSGVRELYGAYHLRATDIEQEIQRLKESRQLAEVTRGPKDLRSLGCLEKIKKEQISKHQKRSAIKRKY
jgi:hypothetical protein